jgi:hypothetical protein
MLAWKDAWEDTWLDDTEFVSALDRWVRDRLTQHHQDAGRDAVAETVGLWSAQKLVTDIRKFGDVGDWEWVSMSLSLLQELIFCADSGGIHNSSNLPKEVARTVYGLRMLRNALMHPAFAASYKKIPGKTPGEGDAQPETPHVELFRPILGAHDDLGMKQVAEELKTDRSALGKRPVAIFALRQLNTAVREYAGIIGLSMMDRAHVWSKKLRRQPP